MFEAHGIGDLVSKLVMIWTSDYGTLLAKNEQLFAQLTGDRRALAIDLRKRWDGGLSLTDAPAVLDGKCPLNQTQAKFIVETAVATGARIEWRCART